MDEKLFDTITALETDLEEAFEVKKKAALARAKQAANDGGAGESVLIAEVAEVRAYREAIGIMHEITAKYRSERKEIKH